MPNIDVKIEDGWLKIYINGVLHHRIKTIDIVAIETWIYDDRYFIEYFVKYKTRSIFCEYNSREKWQHIIEKIDKLI